MATRENEPVIREQPATHKKSTQMILIAFGALLLTILIIDMLLKVRRSNTVEDDAGEADSAAVVEPGSRSAAGRSDFRARIEAETRELEAERLRERQAQERRSIQEQLAAERRRLELQRQRMAGGDTDRSSSLSPRNLLNISQEQAESGMSEFDLNELDRVRASRQAQLEVDVTSSQDTTYAMGAPGYAAAPTAGGVSASTTAAQDNLRRVQELRDRLSQLSAGRGAAPTPTGLGGLTSTTAAAAGASGEIVGQPASVQDGGPLPGQKLLPMATVIRGVLDSRVISDYPGPFRGMVIDDVYDIDRRHILIPKGSRLSGTTVRISNINEPIQARMGMTVDWVVLPNGKKISFDRAATLDREGVAAIKDKVNRHLVLQILGTVAYALISAESERSETSVAGVVTVVEYEDEVGEALREQFQPLVQRYMSLVPTITLNPGTPLRIYLEDEMYIYPWDQVGESLYPGENTADDLGKYLNPPM